VIIARGFAIAATLLNLAGQATAGEKKYGPGVTDSEIKIGNTSPYSGPASAFSMVAKAGEAYVRKINAEGGINGRKIRFISYDDAYSPPKTVEQTRKLVESDEVLFVFNALGTATNSAVQKYLNAKKVPQLFVSSGAAKWNDPGNFPWTRDSPRATRMRGAPTPNIF
jgi:branched-chain amino acid transport system substrate-binding protein